MMASKSSLLLEGNQDLVAALLQMCTLLQYPRNLLELVPARLALVGRALSEMRTRNSQFRLWNIFAQL